MERGDEHRAGQTSVAASIKFDIVPRDKGARSEILSGGKSTVTPLVLHTLDGQTCDALLRHPASVPVSDARIVLMVHGSGSSHQQAPQADLGHRLAARGFASLAFDTRQHDDRMCMDNFYAIRHDIDAAIFTARALGYRHIFLQGHSLGNIQVQFYAATNWDEDIRGVILLAAFANLPWKTKNILVRNDAHFDRLVVEALAAVHEGDCGKRLENQITYYDGSSGAVTAQHFLTYRFEQTSTADGTQWIKRVPYPVLIVRNASDSLIADAETTALFEAAKSDASLVRSLDYVTLPSSLPASLDGHCFVGNEEALAETVCRWLDKIDRTQPTR
jgi:pimeloyl-ACP methyl ester carboxylesterase